MIHPRTSSAAATALAAAAILCASLGEARAQEARPASRPAKTTGPQIAWTSAGPDESRGAVQVTGLDPSALEQLRSHPPDAQAGPRLLSVTVAPLSDGAEKPRPPLIGEYRVTDRAIQFESRFPLDRGLSYRATFDPSHLPRSNSSTEPVVATFSIARRETAPSTNVSFVTPTASTVPENLLKFYLHFSAPMSQGGVYRHIHLVDGSGREVKAPFLELGEELWDPSGTRFTLLLDPGRIKRGLIPREELGPILEAGKSYTLIIDRDWPDAEGLPLKESFRKSFRAGPTDDTPPDPKTWRVEAPKAGTRDPIVLTSPKSLDSALFQRVVTVEDSLGRPVAGHATVSREETHWRFVPDQPWPRQDYRVSIDTVLEDLAGNSVGQPFEVDVFGPIQRKVETKQVHLPFRPRRGD